MEKIKKESLLLIIVFACMFVLLKLNTTLKGNCLDITSLATTLIAYELMKKSIKTLTK